MFLNSHPMWMGIINLTPDSFSDGGLYNSTQKVIEKCQDLIKNGAHIIDFGGISTNPKISNLEISPDEELNRIYEPIKQARKTLPSNILISVDTFSPLVAHTLATENLIDIVNDIYASQKKVLINGKNVSTAHVAAEFNLGLILMHMFHQPQNSIASNCLPEIKKFLQERLNYCKKIGVKHLAIDPGIGYGRFGKTLDNILEILKPESIQILRQLGSPLLIGVSRKAFHLDIDPTLLSPLSRDKLSKEIELKCIEYGAQIIRTHII